MALDPLLLTALQADAPLIFFALEVLYPTFALRLLDGPGVLAIGGNTFTGQDATYGSLSNIDGFQDGVSAEAPHLTFQIQAPSNTAVAALCNPAAQGSQVTLWIGAVNRVTGLAIAPYQLWQGDLDTMALAVDRGARLVKMDAESIWDRFFDTDEGILLDNATHQAIWPGELGLEYVTEVQAQIPWGSDNPRPVVVHDVIGGSPDYSNGVGGYNPAAYVGGGLGFHGLGGFTMGFSL